MLPVFLSRICLLLVTIAVPWGAAVGQGVPSNYVPLDRNESFVTDPRPVDVPSASELYQQSDTQESESETLAQDEPLASVTATSSGIAPPDGAIVALGSDPRHPQVMRAYTSKNYPGVSRTAVQQVRDTQAQYGESLASEDVTNILGRPFSEITQGHGRCADGQSGDLTTLYYLIREGAAPRSMAVVRFCADGMQSIGTQVLR